MPEQKQIDSTAFPTLAEWLNLPPGEFRERIDLLATKARQETAPAVQKGFNMAALVLPELYRSLGGKK